MGTATARQAAQLAELLRSASSAVALTGAGISVPSGIPDFRSPGTGLWESVDPMKVAHIDAFRRDPKTFWGFYRDRLKALGAVSPNPAHRALAQLEAEGLLDAVITQNIDRLHSAAGSRRVVEVHGSIETASCIACGASCPASELAARFQDDVARCERCGGLLKPDVVLFGELLPAPAMAEAELLCERAELLLCVGSSLEVYPVAGLPELTLAAGGRIAIITQGPTPYDARAELKLDGDVVGELDALLAAL